MRAQMALDEITPMISDPPPRVPDRKRIKNKTHEDQKVVISAWVRQTCDVENNYENGYDDVDPANRRILQR